MTREQILNAIANDKMMPFIQPAQLAEIVDFVIKNYKPSLPSDLDVAAHRYAWEKQEHHIDFDGDEYLDYGPRYDAFKAGAKWDAGQGVTIKGLLYGGNLGIPDIPEEFYTDKVEEVIVQIRKK